MPPEIECGRQFETDIDVLRVVETELKCSPNVADVTIQESKPAPEPWPEGISFDAIGKAAVPAQVRDKD